MRCQCPVASVWRCWSQSVLDSSLFRPPTRFVSRKRDSAESAVGAMEDDRTAGPAVHVAPSQAHSHMLVTAAVVGCSNAGKSELVNKLVGCKMTAVSPKRNTTVSTHLGAFTQRDVQVVLYDTPGVVLGAECEQRPAISERIQSAWATAAASHIVLFIVDAEEQFRLRRREVLELARNLGDGFGHSVRTPKKGLNRVSSPDITTAMREQGRVFFENPSSLTSGSLQHTPTLALVLNKQDKLPGDLRQQVLRHLEDQLRSCARFGRCFWVSAMKGVGIGTLRQFLVSKARPGAWLLPGAEAHDKSEGQLALELVREKLFRVLHQELPYAVTVTLGAPPPMALPDGRLQIVVDISVRTSVQRGIIVGSDGAVVRHRIEVPVQAELERLLRQAVRLIVRVGVGGSVKPMEIGTTS